MSLKIKDEFLSDEFQLRMICLVTKIFKDEFWKDMKEGKAGSKKGVQARVRRTTTGWSRECEVLNLWFKPARTKKKRSFQLHVRTGNIRYES